MKHDLIERLVERIEERLEPERAAAASQFVRTFYANVPPGDMTDANPDDLYGAAMSLWGFAQERQPRTPKVRVYNPHIDDHGWKSSHTVVEIVNDDMPFLVDSVVAELNRLRVEVHLVIHPLVHVERDPSGHLVALRRVGEERDGDVHESCMHVQITEQTPDDCARLTEHIHEVLDEARLAVDDWSEMRARGREAIEDLRAGSWPVPQEDVDEAIAFLEWTDKNHFIYLGYREYDFQGEGESTRAVVRQDRGLGILRDVKTTVFGGLRNLGSLPLHVVARIRSPEILRITKANRRSRLHRPVYMDTIAVKSLDADGQDKSERLFVGLFTSEAYSHNPVAIPLLRRRLANVLARSNFPVKSHNYRVLAHLLETYPRDELFQITDDELFELSIGILNLQERQRTALFVRVDPFERFVSCLVYVPRDRFDTGVRMAFASILEDGFEGKIRDYYTLLTDTPLARLRFIVSCRPGDLRDVDIGEIERQLQEAARSWTDRLEDALVAIRGEEPGIAAMARFGDAFPAAYWERFNADTAVADIDHIEEALETDDVAINLYRPLEAEPHELRLKIYSCGRPSPLSDVLPMIENMGLSVNAERPYELKSAHLPVPISIREFEVAARDGSEIDVPAVKGVFQEAFALVWHGELEDDGFNQLVLRAGFTAREVTVLRAYARYLRQVNIPFSLDYMEQTLADNAQIARLLVDLFETRFDPLIVDGSEARGTRIRARILALLDTVQNLDDDRIIRRFLNVILVTLRTNYYQVGEDGTAKTYLALKLDSRLVEELPLPRPFREIFVYSPEVEAIHLRGGMVARGGIRWSDRREDFRTEVLGLMKAQMVKNAVIVPVGSKGGFVVKPSRHVPAEVSREQVIECYKTLMRGLLDLTDNYVDGGVISPEQVVCHDGDDPYLVVAADKGTATFSDIANGVAADYGFWLDDAFASGGSAGYDHKKMAITARGTWECVKRHFREMGTDIQSAPFTVVGVGDMAGDVFGNGMLLSEHIGLAGAFNHLHIFVDPNPDAAVGFAERQRLFGLERSSWDDYDRSLISEGGGVFDRKAKSIAITPQMQERFGIDDDTLTPGDLIRVLLQARVDLLWFGGIGTFVKASTESHVDVGDRTNDSLRINAAQIGAKVVGEGANLGMTQRARVEFAALGGRLNTDAIDNSGGVDCSDHEVNIKILLGTLERADDLTRKQRDDLLKSMTDEVGELSIRANYLQGQALSVTHQMGVHLLDRLARFVRDLQKKDRLDRVIEFLPDDDVLAERFQKGLGYTRPELAVLLSYAKIVLNDELLASDLPEDPFTERDLMAYFPKALRESYAEAIAEHRLRREIICTVITNEIVNRVGIAFIHEVGEKTGAASAEIARAFVVSREILNMYELWASIEALDNQVPAMLQSSMLIECGRLVERSTVWFLREAPHPLDIEKEIATYSGGVGEFAAVLEELLAHEDQVTLESLRSEFIDDGAPPELARGVARLGFLTPAFDVVRIARESDLPVPDVARLYFELGARFGMEWLRRAAARLPRDTAWDKRAVSAIIEDLYGHQSALTRRVLSTTSEITSPERVVQDWARANPRVVVRTEQLLGELQALGSTKFSMLAVANRQLKAMYG